MFRSYDHHQGGSQILAKITFIYNTLYVPILKTGDMTACHVMCESSTALTMTRTDRRSPGITQHTQHDMLPHRRFLI